MKPKTDLDLRVIDNIGDIGGRIQELSARVGGKRAFAKALGVHESGIYKYIRGENMPGLDAIIGMVKATGVSFEWLATGEGEMFDKGRAYTQVREGVIEIAPYLKRKGEGAGVDNSVNILLTANSSAFLIHSIEADPAELSIRFVSSDSMFPTLSNGDAVILDASYATIPTHGIYGIMVDGKERPQFCRLQRLPDDLVKVGFDNKSYDPFTFNFSRTDVVVLGLARWVLKFL